MAKQKQPPPPPTAAPWVAGPAVEPEPEQLGGGDFYDPAAALDLEAFLDEATQPAAEAMVPEAGVEPHRPLDEEPKPAPRPVMESAALPQPTAVDRLRVAAEAPSTQVEPQDTAPDEEPWEPPLPLEAPTSMQRPAPAPVRRQAPAPASSQSVGTDWDRPTPDAAPVGGAEWRKPVVRPVAESGWRRWVYFASAKTINLGENPADISARELDRRLQTPLEREFSIGVVQLKGGAAKTTTAIGIGNAFAEARTDAVVAIDVNPDRGNMARRTELRTNSNVFTLIEAKRPTRVQEVRVHTNQTPAGLEVLASAQDPAAAQAFSESDYAEAFGILRDFYSLIISDCGTNITHSATQAVLAGADALVIPLDARSDSADEAVATIDYLHSAYAKDPKTNEPIVDDQGNRQWLYRHLLARTVVVVSHQRPGRRMFDVDKSLAWFRERVMDVHVIPYDPHLEESGEIIPDRLDAATKLAYRELAAKIASAFPSTYSTDSHLRRAV